MSFSIFQFYNYDNIATIQKDLLDAQDIERDVKGFENEKLISGINNFDEFDISKLESLQIDNINIPYIYFEAHTERARDLKNWGMSLKSREERINPISSNLLVFELEEKIIGIVFCGINRSKAIIKDCFPSETWGNVKPIDTEITEDVLYWIFKRFIDTPKESLSQEYQLFITALESYMGKTRDNVNAMRGEGSRISTILGTLAFLFNNEELKAIRPAIQYGNEKVLVEIGLTGTFKTWPNSYKGENFKTLIGIRKEIALAIFIYYKILPSLVQCYKEQRENDEWSPQLKLDFIRRLGTMIREKVDQVLTKVEAESKIDDHKESSNIDDEEDYLEIYDEEDEVPE